MNSRVRKIVLGYLVFIVAGVLLGIAVSWIAGLPVGEPGEGGQAPSGHAAEGEH